jgi:TolA-binding protein
MHKVKSQKSKVKNTIQKLKFCILTCGFAFYVLNFTLTCYAQDNKEDEALFVAKRAFEDGFYEVSLDLLERFQKNYPNSPKLDEANLLIGECYFHQNRYLDALAKFEGILNQPSAKSLKDAIFYWIAEVHFKGNNFNKASAYYKMLVEEFPNSSYAASAYYSLGWCSFQVNDFSLALEYFKTVETKYPKEPQALDVPMKIIECFYNLKDYSVIKERANNYIKLFSKDAFRLSYLYFYMGEADYYLNNFKDAIDEYSKVFANSQDQKLQALSKIGIGWSHLKLKEYKEAEAVFLEVKQDNLEKKSLDVLLLGQAILMAETNRLNEAKMIYGELLQVASEPLVLMQAYLGKADAYYNLADYQEAISVYKEALERVETKNTPQELIDKLHYNLAWAYLKQAEFKDAISEFRKVVKETGDKIVKISALCQIGDAYQDSGDYNKAEESYDNILKEHPDSLYSDYVQYQLGLTLLKASNYDGAIMSFLSIKKNYPQSQLLDDASYALGLTYFQRQDYNASRDALQVFLSEFKDSKLRSQGLYLLGSSLYNLGKFNDAIEAFKEIVRLYSQDMELTQKAEYEIADCYYQIGNEKEAMARFKMLRSKYPDSSLTPEIMWWLGEYYYRNNDLVLARRYFSSLIQDFSKSNLVADAYYALGSIQEEQSNYKEAIKSFKRVIELEKADLSGQAAIAIADIYALTSEFDSAVRAYQDTLKDHPGLAHLVYPKMGDLFYKRGNFDEALNFYRKSLDAAPLREMPGIQFKIAEVFQAKGNQPMAIEEYLKVTYLYSEDNSLATRALLRVAAIYEDKENYQEALNIYKRIISMDVEEKKYAQERIEWINSHTLIDK